MKGDFRPLIRPDLAERAYVKANELNMSDRTVLVNLAVELFLNGNFTIELEPKSGRVKVAENTYLVATSRMRKEIL